MTVGSSATGKHLVIRGASGSAKTTLGSTRFRLESTSNGIMRALAASRGNRTADKLLTVKACGSNGFSGTTACCLIRAGTPRNCRLSKAGRRIAFACMSSGAPIVRIVRGIAGRGLPRSAPSMDGPGANSSAGL